MKRIFICISSLIIAGCNGKPDCSNHKRFYRWGYGDGEQLRLENKHLPDVEQYAKEFIEPVPLLAGESKSSLNTECYCQGYRDGVSNQKMEFPNEEN